MKWTLTFTMILTLSACSTYNAPDSPPLNASAVWVIMPLENNSSTPLAAEKAEQILSSQLYRKGINAIIYPKTPLKSLTDILDQTSKYKHAEVWLATYPADYIITGSVEEWHYKNGLDAEPAVGLTLEIKDATNKKSLWRATGSRVGWGRESVSGAGIVVVETLVNGLNFIPGPTTE